MKRYRNLAVIAVVTTISLGVFYTKVATSESNLPVYYINTEKGDPKSANNIEINANIYENNTNKNLTITTKGNEYRTNNSIFDFVNSKTFSAKKLNDLQKEEKNFMRGKNSDSSFYVDNDYVWQANVKGKNMNFNARNNDYKLYIDGLDLQSKDRYTFKLDIPNEEDFSYIDVEDVQLIGKELIVTTFQNKNFGENIRCIYRISITSKKMIDSKEFALVKGDDASRHTEISNPSEIDLTQPKQYYVYREIEAKETSQENGEVLSEQISNTLHILNLETGKEEKINLTKEQLEMSKQSELIQSDNMLYFIIHNDTNVTINKYSLERQKIEGEPIVIAKDKGVTFSNNKIINGNLYTITNRVMNEGDRVMNDGKFSIYIIDLATGSTTYEGLIKVKDTKENKEELLKKLELFDFSVN